MRVVIQRVNQASVSIHGQLHGKIDRGLCIFFGVNEDADENDLPWLVNKIINLRIFNDSNDKMNLSVNDVDGEILLISQFTLHASTKKGNRPSFIQAEKPERAEVIYNTCISMLSKNLQKPIQSGVFGGYMKIDLQNDGPVTIIIDTDLRW